MTKTTARPVARKSKWIKADVADRVKTAVCISPEAFQRLSACSIKEDMTQSEVIELLIENTLSGYVLSRRGGGIRDLAGRQSPIAPSVSEDRLGSDVSINLTVPQLA